MPIEFAVTSEREREREKPNIILYINKANKKQIYFLGPKKKKLEMRERVTVKCRV